MAKKNKTGSAKSAVSAVVSFVLSLTIVLLTLVVALHTTLFNDRTIYSKVTASTYFAELNNDIDIRCRTIAVKNGIDYSFIEGVITSGRIDADYTVYFNSMSGENPHGGRDTIDEKGLADEIYKSITVADPDMTSQEKENARIASSEIATEYKNTMVVEVFERFVGFSDTFKSYSKYVFYILAVSFVYFVCVLLWLNGKSQKHRLFRKFSIVGGSAGLTMLVFSVFIKLSEVTDKITFASTQREYNLFISFIDGFIDTMIVAGAGWLVVCIVLLVLWYMSVTGRIRK